MIFLGKSLKATSQFSYFKFRTSFYDHRAGLDGRRVQLASIQIFSGAVAQLGERLICIQEAAGSIPTSSTILKLLWPFGQCSGELGRFPTTRACSSGG